MQCHDPWRHEPCFCAFLASSVLSSARDYMLVCMDANAAFHMHVYMVKRGRTKHKKHRTMSVYSARGGLTGTQNRQQRLQRYVQSRCLLSHAHKRFVVVTLLYATSSSVRPWFSASASDRLVHPRSHSSLLARDRLQQKHVYLSEYMFFSC